MRLVEFIGSHNERVFINPEHVTHVKAYRKGSIYIFFNNSRADGITKVVVVGELDYVINKLLNK